ncbi:CapA family protein [uncultured Desulfuromonas sp.]|uniref:CapA family protein n=1 Tax=uncultured Desulfuromonas sp. TaxID=181013 RepID=UPI002AAB9CA0|nr:CapA family protein [uncultured Desulfuromonas sp.]
MASKPSIRLAIIGDLLFTVPYASQHGSRGLESLSAEIITLFASCDLVVANLESTLPADQRIATEPRVLGTAQQFDSLIQAHINVVTLANNHAFDALDSGFRKTSDKLNELGIHAFGAGNHLTEAQAPVSLTINGVRIAFIGAAATSTGMGTFAGNDSAGVAPLETKAICDQIQQLKTSHDHVVFIPHWGEERFRFPAPDQVAQGRMFIDAGASVVAGHHPHVLQGTETYHHGVIAYSLGNFLSNPVYWQDGDSLTWDKFERTSQIIVFELDQEKITRIEQVPVFDDGTQIQIEKSGWGEKCLHHADTYLRQGITPALYAKEVFRVHKLLPFKSRLRWDTIRRLRPKHFRKAVKLLLKN